MSEADIRFLDCYPRRPREKAGHSPAAVIPIAGGPALVAQQRLRTVGVARVNFGCQEKQARQVGLRDRPPTSASIVSIVGRPRPQLTGGVPADGARFHVLQWERDDRIWAALCRRALGLPPIVNVAAGTVPGDSDPPPSAA